LQALKAFSMADGAFPTADKEALMVVNASLSAVKSLSWAASSQF
jgi:hypothetical protein